MANRQKIAILVPLMAYVTSLMFSVATTAVRAQDVRTVWDRVYTADQAARGQEAYAANCATCHKPDLSGNEDGGTGAPSLKGVRFMQIWEGSNLAALASKIRETMPRNNAGGLSEETYTDIISFVLRTNGFPAGTTKLALNTNILERIDIGPNEKDRKTVWDGVYTAEQAAKGQALYQERCATCHSADFVSGTNAPPLKGEPFWRTWELSNLTSIASKIRDTMPRNSPGSMDDASYMAILARILEVNGFPSGTKELRWFADELTPVQIVKTAQERQAGPRQIQNFTLVQAVGCLARGANDTWVLTKATEPAVTQTEEPTPTNLRLAEGRRLGEGTIGLYNAFPWGAASFVGRKVEARGTFRRLPNQVTISVTSLVPIPGDCSN